MSQKVAGTFCSTSTAIVGAISDVLVIPSGVTGARLNLPDCDANNTVKTQKSTNNGSTWADQTTYNSAQANTGIVVVAGEHWRLVSVAQQTFKAIRYSLDVES